MRKKKNTGVKRKSYGKGNESDASILKGVEQHISKEKVEAVVAETEEEAEEDVEEEGEVEADVDDGNELGEEEGENEEENDEEEQDEDYELKNYGIALKMPKRKNRGKNLKKLIGEDLEKDEQFWNNSIWEEEEIDEEYVNSEGEEEYIDITDSDFDEDEDEAEDDMEEEDTEKNEKELEDDLEKKKKKKMYAYLEKLKKQKQNNMARYNIMKNRKYDTNNLKRGIQKYGADQKSEKERKEEQEKLKNERMLKKKKKLENAYLMLHRSTRDTTRQKTEQVKKLSELRKIKKENRFKKFYENRKKKKSMQREMTREERLEEAKITEQYNIQSLLQLQAWEEEKKKYVENKKILYHRPKNVFISFSYSKDKTFPSNENLKYEVDPYSINNDTVLANDTLSGNAVLSSNINMLEALQNEKIVVGGNNDANKIEKHGHDILHQMGDDELAKKEIENMTCDQADTSKIMNQKRENENDKTVIGNAIDTNSSDNRKEESSITNYQFNWENIDQCEDLNIDYLNENDALNFGFLNKVNKSNNNNSSSNNNSNHNRNSNINNDSSNNNSGKRLGRCTSNESDKKRKVNPPVVEERQIYIVTDSRELEMYSNYNNNKDYLNQIKNKNNLCAITNLEGKYFDPLTKKYYNNAEAFKSLRFSYHKEKYDSINKQISLMVNLFKSKLTEIEENTKNATYDNI
ncbi:YL1 nuclear protein, putative [Plasmodium malariae]|uniref:YL1 nuclear protein, putative n=1 Tax=Plasmodium malariae TaxID=5858 RepID=A0A1A8W8X9_PLAMA|nr:YL1 nuclear protein, putative [Plasmodium malariae]SBS88433.1 YL1 nuclear protein, putative [Plasmodium malariae]SCO93932.1 YL1 nuclear protein, putative [Plasmodium malariae]